MIHNYVEAGASALIEIFPSLSLKDARCIVIGGFREIDEANPELMANILCLYNYTRDEMTSINDSYKKDGTAGTRCNE